MNLWGFFKNISGRKFYIQMFVSIVLAFGTATAQFLTTQQLGTIIDSIDKGYEETVNQFLYIMFCYLCYMFGTAVFTFYSDNLAAEFSRCLQIKIGKKLCSAQYHEVEQIEDGDLLAMVTKDMDSIKSWIGVLTKSGFLCVGLGLVPVTLFQWCNWKLALFALGMIPLNALPSLFFSRKLSPFHDNEKKAYADVLSHFTESLRFLVMIKAYQLEPLFLEKHKGKLKNYRKIRKKRMLFEKLTEEYNRSFGHISRIGLLLLSAYFIEGGEMTIGRLTSVILCAEFVGEGLKIAASIPLYLPAAKAGMVRIQKLLELSDEMSKNTEAFSSFPSIQTGEAPVYEVQNLTFSYGTAPVLHDINFCVYEGEKIAVVGESGCGKTTLFKLLSGLYMPEKEQIFFRGVDLTALSSETFRNQITTTTQEAFLFQATFEDNIKIAKSDGSREEIMAVCKNAQLESLVQTLDNGYDTEMNTTLSPVSKGQMQRINLARAFLRDTRLFLLDEPTSALDSDTAGCIWNYLFTDCADKTLLVIIHDLEEICRFHKILVLGNGTVAGFGTHNELIQNCYQYRKFYEEKRINRRKAGSKDENIVSYDKIYP